MSIWNLFCCCESNSPPSSNHIQIKVLSKPSQQSQFKQSSHSPPLQHSPPTHYNSSNPVYQLQFQSNQSTTHSQTLNPRKQFQEYETEINHPHKNNHINDDLSIKLKENICSVNFQCKGNNPQRDLTVNQNQDQFVKLDNLQFTRNTNIRDWTLKQVIQFLQHIGLKRYQAIFYINKIKGRDLISLKDNEMTQDLKMNYEHIQILKKYVTIAQKIGLSIKQKKNIHKKHKPAIRSMHKLDLNPTRNLNQINNMIINEVSDEEYQSPMSPKLARKRTQSKVYSNSN